MTILSSPPHDARRSPSGLQSIEKMVRSWRPSSTGPGTYLPRPSRDQRRTVQSWLQVARRRPLGSMARPHTVCWWPCKRSWHAQSSTSSAQTRTESSYEAEKRRSSCGCHFTNFTSCAWPESTETHSSSSSSGGRTADGVVAGGASQIQMLLSREQVARREPSWLQDTLLTSFSWPSSVPTHSHSSAEAPSSRRPRCQMTVVESKLAAAR
mmetsp:Transcript_16067/g.51266  ORF Transcript_16067/g.51266 Transcript_16067/m.51266 type:complete len:210 (-) Transcript_16067:279-908(-)